MNHRRKPSKHLTADKPLRANKSLGQNFLVDHNAIGRILGACAFQKTDRVLEIGPGAGALTREIIPRVGHLIAVETDRRLWEKLREEFKNTDAEIIHADFLKYDLEPIFKKHGTVKLFGNLPYYISTPIIGRIIEHRKFFKEFYLTVQWEFAKRMVAKPGTEDYSSFSCFVQFYAEPEILFKIKNTCFNPKPKVDSCFLKLRLRERPLYEVEDEEFLFKVIRLGFQQRRKTLANALGVLGEKGRILEILDAAAIAPTLRAENLSLQQFVGLSSLLRTEQAKQVDQ